MPDYQLGFALFVIAGAFVAIAYGFDVVCNRISQLEQQLRQHPPEGPAGEPDR